MAARGIDRKPTEQELADPPDKRPWTEYDGDGNKQAKPDFKAFAPSCCCCLFGPTCCVFELQWCSHCGQDADTTCDVLCRCQTNRLKICICCGPQRDDMDCECCRSCCCCQRTGWFANSNLTMNECCECDCIENHCGWRYAGCQLPCTCCHLTCVKCPGCCTSCLCCEEEVLYMDGDLKPLRQVRLVVESQLMERA